MIEKAHIHYINKITLNKIKQILCPFEKKKSFVNYIFEPLKIENMTAFSDSYNVITSHLSEFMNGNCAKNGKRQSINSLKIWAKKLCTKSIYSQILQRVYSYENLNSEQLHMLSDLFLSDKNEMPPSLSIFIEQKIKTEKYGEAILLLILWSVYGKDQIHLLSPIYKNTTIRKSSEFPSLLQHIVSSNPIFIGREHLLQSIYKTISDGNHFVFLQGMGGIGKSECAKQYAQKYKEQYHTIVFAECNKSLMELVNDNTVFTLTHPFVSERICYPNGQVETDYEFYQRKLTQIRCAVDDQTLIILDNVDHHDPMLSDFLTGMCHVIITTRWQSQLCFPNETLSIDEMKDMEICKKIFSAYYGIDISSDPYIEKIISYFMGHTLALELVAKQMKVSHIPSEKMWNIITQQKENTLPEEFPLQNEKRDNLNMAMHIQRIFNITSLSETEVYILTCLSLLPKSGMEKERFKKICGLQNYVAMNNLVWCSWIRELDGILSMHTLIKEAVQITYNPNLQSCKEFIERLMQEFSAIKCYYSDFSQKTLIYNIASHIYTTFPEPVTDFYEFYEWVELLLSHYCQADRALHLSQKLLNIYLKQYGKHHFKTARMLCRVGCNEKNLNRLEKSQDLLKQGKRIIQQIERKSNKELLYISDVDVILIDLYLKKYSDTMENDILCTAEELCNEIISIRSSLTYAFDCMHVNCVFSYHFLAKIAIYRKNECAAERYLAQASEECTEKNLGLFSLFIDNVKADLAIEQDNIQQAIAFLQLALKNAAYYFGAGTTGDAHVNVIDLKLKLGTLYEQTGELELALRQYQEIINNIQFISYYNDKYTELKEHLEYILSACKNSHIKSDKKGLNHQKTIDTKSSGNL